MIGTLLDCQIIMNLLLSEIPFRIIAIEIEGSQAWVQSPSETNASFSSVPGTALGMMR